MAESSKNKNTCCGDYNGVNFGSPDCPSYDNSASLNTDGIFTYDEDGNKNGKDLRLHSIKSSNPTEPTKYMLDCTIISDNDYLHNRPQTMYFNEDTYRRLQELFNKSKNPQP